MVKTIGSSRDTDEIERLMAEGRKYISDQNGPLFPGIDEDENAVDAFVSSLTNSQIKVVGPELIFGRLYDYIGFNSIPSEMFRHMVICRLFNPGSKLKTVDYLERYLHASYDINKIYVAKYWPIVTEWAGKDSLEADIAELLLPPPIDQRYGEEEMDYIISTIINFQ